MNKHCKIVLFSPQGESERGEPDNSDSESSSEDRENAASIISDSGISDDDISIKLNPGQKKFYDLYRVCAFAEFLGEYNWTVPFSAFKTEYKWTDLNEENHSDEIGLWLIRWEGYSMRSSHADRDQFYLSADKLMKQLKEINPEHPVFMRTKIKTDDALQNGLFEIIGK